MSNVVQFPQDEKRRATLRIVQVMEWQTEAKAMRFLRTAVASYRRQIESQGYDQDRVEYDVGILCEMIETELAARSESVLPYEYAMGGAA